MFRRIDDFFKAYDAMATGTLSMFERLTDESLDRAVEKGRRSLRELGWHIVTTVPEMMKLTGLPLTAVDPESTPPRTAAEIAEGYRLVSAEFRKAVEKNWTDKSLTETDNLYGQQWERGFTLTGLLNHEIHHRGQMTVLMRQAGLRVPGLYGPAQEEWADMGMQPPPY